MARHDIEIAPRSGSNSMFGPSPSSRASTMTMCPWPPLSPLSVAVCTPSVHQHQDLPHLRSATSGQLSHLVG